MRSSGANAFISLRRLFDYCAKRRNNKEISEPQAKSFFRNSSLLPPHSSFSCPLFLKNHRQKVMDAPAPNAPVVAAGEGAARYGQALFANERVLFEEMIEELITRSHRAVEYAEG